MCVSHSATAAAVCGAWFCLYCCWHLINCSCFSVVSLQENFDGVCEFQASGPSHILVLTKGEFGQTIIEEWLEVLGPPNVAEAQESAATRSALRLIIIIIINDAEIIVTCHTKSVSRALYRDIISRSVCRKRDDKQ